jgi:hypothetical protein
LRPAAKPDACVVRPKMFSTWIKPRFRAFLACRLVLGLFARPHNETVIRISFKFIYIILSILPSRKISVFEGNTEYSNRQMCEDDEFLRVIAIFL